MLIFNRECITKSGEKLTPLTIEGDCVVCATRSGNTLYKKINDFDDSNTKKSNAVISVIPVIRIKKQLLKEINLETKEDKKTVVVQEVIKKEPETLTEEIKEKLIIEKPNNNEVQKIVKKKKADKEISKDNNEEYI